MALLPTELHDFHGKDGVHASGTKAFKVERDELKAQRSQMPSDIEAHLRVEEASDLIGRQFNAGELVLLVPNAELVHAELFPQVFLSLIDTGDALGGHGNTIRDPAR